MYRVYWRLIVATAAVVLCMSATVQAQTDDRSFVDTVRTFDVDTGAFHMTKSPTVALLLSAALPGAGQVYLGQTWKVPIIWGLAGGFLYGALVQNSRYHEWADSTAAAESREDAYLAAIYGNRREFYRDDRDKWWIYLGITYVANLLDAYIAAHLYDFDVSTPGSASKLIGPSYDPRSGQYTLNYSLHF